MDSGVVEHVPNGECNAIPGFALGRELLPALLCKAVELSAAALVGLAPFWLYPSLLLHPVERGIQGALLDDQNVLRESVDSFGDREAVQRSSVQHLQHQ